MIRYGVNKVANKPAVLTDTGVDKRKGDRHSPGYMRDYMRQMGLAREIMKADCNMLRELANR